MNNIYGNSNIIYAITEEHIQEIAQLKVGRTLTEEELYSVEKGLSYGLPETVMLVLDIAIEEATCTK